MNVDSAPCAWSAFVSRQLRRSVHPLGAGLLCLTLVARAAHAGPQKIDDYHWPNVDRIVAIGDVHGAI